MLKTPLPITKHPETDTDKYHTYLVNHVTRQTDNQPIATISPEQSAQRTWTIPQVTILAVLASLTLVALWTFGTGVLTLIFALVTVLYTCLLCLSAAWMTAVARAQPETPFNDEMINELAKAPWPTYTILCPLYYEKNIVPQFVSAMKAIDYPADCLQVLFLTEEDDIATRDALRAMTLPTGYEVLTVPAGTPRTKPRACNYGLQFARGEYCVIFDAEDCPDPLQLKKAVLTFASNDVNVACVQARLNFYNSSMSSLCRFFTIEYSLWFDLILPGLQRLGFSLPLGGTSNHFRIAALKALGGWDSFNVTEDCDLGLKLAKYNFKTIMLDSTTYEEANSRVFSWIRQRSRWIKGYMQTYLVHTRSVLRDVRRGNIRELLSLHLFIGAGSVVLLINPIMWCMFVVYLIWRPVDLYHQLFPWPVLYAGMLCFLVGNFLPVYVSMIACVRREQYSLVKWCLLLPLYWILASVAAFLAGYELIVKPHVWHKTEHGLHLKDKKSTAKVAAITKAGKPTIAVKTMQPMGNVTQSVRAMSTIPVPAVSKVRGKRVVKARDPWLLATIVLACVCSVAATTYFFQQHEILLYGDASSHVDIARRVFFGATPGLAQLGTVWLPLPHIIMWPFVWNDYLWRTGLAGSFPAMICYIITVCYLYLTVRSLTGYGSVSFICVLAFLLNPNILYLQSTPLSELPCLCTFTAAGYYFLRWTQTDRMQYIVLCAIATMLATLARYDGWTLCILLPIGIVYVYMTRKLKWRCIEGNIVLFGFLASICIPLWFIWNMAISSDILYFQRGPFSSQTQQIGFKQGQLLYSYHSVWQSLRFYAIDSGLNSGYTLCGIALLGLFISLVAWKWKPPLWAIFIFISPFFFYAFSLYTGQAIIWVPGAVPTNAPNQFFNVRYGVQMIPSVVVLIACVFTLPKMSSRTIRSIAECILLFCIIGQSIWITVTGIVTLQDGQVGVSCYSRQPTDFYLARHYDSGKILVDAYTDKDLDSKDIGINLQQVIYLGSYRLWDQALSHPERVVEWILFNPNDEYSKKLNIASVSRFFTPVFRTDGLTLYHLKADVLHTHPLSPYFDIHDYSLCGGNKKQ